MTNINHYRKYLFMYGIVSVLLVLEHYEREENYEECKKIIDCIKEQESRLGIKLYTKITEDCIKDVVESYRNFNISTIDVIENSKYYSNLIINELRLIK